MNPKPLSLEPLTPKPKPLPSTAQEFAEFFFSVQQEAIESLFRLELRVWVKASIIT